MNSTFADNSADKGGAVFLSGIGTPTLENDLFSGNTASTAGAAVFGSGAANADSNVYWNNLANGSEDDCNACNTNTNAVSAPSNPLTLPLALYGGTTPTLLPQPGSAAISNASSADVSAQSMGKDQRGFTITGTTCSSGTVDAGADQTNYLTVNGSSETLAGAITSGNTAGSEDVDFASSLDGTSLTLSSALPTITGQISIIRPGAAKLEIAGPANSTVLQVNASAEAAIYGLTFGSRLTNAGTLTLAASAIASAGLEAGIGAGGGGLNNSGTAFITDSTFAGDQVSGNATAAGKGGAIYNTGALSLTGATLSGDAVTDPSGAGSAEGGAIYNGAGAPSPSATARLRAITRAEPRPTTPAAVSSTPAAR